MTKSEQARADHECAACEGHKTVEHAFDAEHYAMVPCSVCAGAGRISDRMPAADALADAETLIVNAMAGRWYLDDGYRASLAFANELRSAEDAAGWALIEAHKNGRIQCAYAHAAAAACAAFRAVPGLRGQGETK